VTDEPTPAGIPEIPDSFGTMPAAGQLPESPKMDRDDDKKSVSVGIGMLIAIGFAAVLLGFLGGIASHALLPASAGAHGKQGQKGDKGNAGQQGIPGSDAVANLSALGVCYDVTYGKDNNADSTSVMGVYLSTPTVTNGTQSCQSGQFLPVQGKSS